MNLKPVQELCELNQAFERITEALKRMENASSNLPEIVRQWRAEVVIIQVETNREFIDGFEAAFNDDEEWASNCLRQCKEREGDREQIYAQVLDREAAREKKGLPPRVTILPDWDSGDEERYDEAQAGKRGKTPQDAKRRASAKFRGPAGTGKGTAIRPSVRRDGT